jgi:regulator of sigma E protease
MTEFIYSLIGFVVAVGILVTVHEFGHFWVARRLGVKVLRFSVGFGKPLYTRRAGPDQTEYVLAALPLGGYVKMLDETEGEVPERERARAFNRQPVWKRALIVLAGPGFNFLFAIFAYWLVYLGGTEGLKPVIGRVVEGSVAEQAGLHAGEEIVSVDGRPNRSWDEHRLYLLDRMLAGARVALAVRDTQGQVSTREIDLSRVSASQADARLLERGIGLYGYLPEPSPVIGGVMSGGPAQSVGLQAGDRVLEVDGVVTQGWADLVREIRARPGRSVSLKIERAGEIFQRELITEKAEANGQPFGRIGVEPQRVEIPEELRVKLRDGPFAALSRATEETWRMSAVTLKMLFRMLKLEVSSENISGPLTIAQYAGQSARIGLDSFLMFLGVISISLGVLNLLPVPVLDGGHLLYYAAEAIRGRPLPQRVLEWGQQFGIAILVALMALALYNDAVRLFG